VTVAADILAVPLILEFVFAPINLWTGRTMDNFRRFTGFREAVATRVFAPVKLMIALALIVGLFVRPLELVGAGGALLVSVVYLIRLLAPGRRDGAGLVGFTLFGAFAAAVLALRL
jgi:hypothetical protein